MIIAGQHLPFILTDTVREAIGIERRHGRDRQNLPRLAIQNNNRTGFLAQSSCSVTLDINI